MTYLLDTCVISELVKPKPDRNVVKWISSQKHDQFAISVLTIGEIQKGISRLAKANRRSELESWLRDVLLNRFSGRILSVSDEIALKWGELSAQGEARGKRVAVIDGLLASTAVVHGLVLVTRNVGDFKFSEVPVLNPWD